MRGVNINNQAVGRDTPLANTPDIRFAQDTIKPKVMTYAEKRAVQQLVKDKNIRAADSIVKRSLNSSNFNKKKPLTREEYNEKAKSNKNKEDAVKANLVDCRKRTASKGSCVDKDKNIGESTKDNR
jgi:hypothetical protein